MNATRAKRRDASGDKPQRPEKIGSNGLYLVFLSLTPQYCMAGSWDAYGRQGIDIAHKISSFGFSAVKTGTRFGFSVARTFASTAVDATAAVVDIALFGGGPVARPIFGTAVSTVLTVAEQITLAPLHLSEYITSTSLLAAHSSINVLSVIFPGSSDASFSLASFIGLVRREWALTDNGTMPEKLYGFTQIARAVVAWVALQGVTQEWQEQRWLKHLKELDVKDPPKTAHNTRQLKHKPSRVRVTSDVIFPGQQSHQVIAADIGDPDARRSRPLMTRTISHISLHRTRVSQLNLKLDLSLLSPIQVSPEPLSNSELKTTLRRLSKMVLAGYGGASLLFFGISPSMLNRPHGTMTTASESQPSSFTEDMEKQAEEAELAHAIDAAEAEAAGDGELPDLAATAKHEYSWWDVLLGRHDQEIFENFAAGHPVDKEKRKVDSKQRENNTANIKSKAVIGNEHLMPRFWVLTDYDRGEVVLVIRGTMSLNEIAVDLTCDSELFEPAVTSLTEEDEAPVPGHYAFPTFQAKEAAESNEHKQQYHVHGGMAKMAKAMGSIGKPVHRAVQEALYNHPNFDLIICGHSLGAGVAALLGLMWADPRTCQTVQSSGLPVGRQVQVYAFAPPTVTDGPLSRLSQKLIVSLVYSHDAVSRLSLGSVRDLRNAAMWLCDAEANGRSEGWSAVTTRAKRWKDSGGSQEDMDWFIAVRKTLEANMQSTFMYPPGRVLWAMRDGDLHPSHRLNAIPQTPGGNPEEKLRLFEVLDVEKVFSQIVFARDMLSAHLAHRYDNVLHDLL